MADMELDIMKRLAALTRKEKADWKPGAGRRDAVLELDGYTVTVELDQHNNPAMEICKPQGRVLRRLTSFGSQNPTFWAMAHAAVDHANQAQPKLEELKNALKRLEEEG